jgi:hypothetical protein
VSQRLSAALELSSVIPGARFFPCHGIADGRCACPEGADCGSAGKHPLVRWREQATADLATLERWAERWPGCNWGLVTGAGSGIVVLDVDVKDGKDGMATLRRLATEHGGRLPCNLIVRTGSGGLHLYLEHPGFHVSNSAGKLGPGLDIKADGGYCVAPGSSHVSGGRYEVERALPPAPLPEWLLDLLRPVAALPPAAPRPAFPPASPELLEAAREALVAHGPAIEGEGGDDHTYVAAATLTHNFALTQEEAYSLMAEWNETCRPPWSEEELREKIAHGDRYGTALYGCRRRPVIELVAGKLSEIVSQAERALMDSGVPIFSRGGALVRPVVEEVDAAHGRRTKIARLARLDATYMGDLLSRHARFERFNAKSDEWVSADPPPVVAQTLLSRTGEWGFRALTALIATQTMRQDGTILDRPGFDPATRLVLMAPPSMPAIPDAPTRRDAERALALLESLLTEFPFVDEPSRSVALSGLITPVVRGAFPVSPGHAATASTPGTGKSYLWDVAAAICIGQPMPVMAAGRTEEESEKRLGAAVIAGQPVIALDNVNGGIGGDALCQIIERPVVDVRILGRSELARVESRSTVYFTGNNLQIVGDATRRILLARLDANMERPELRQFGGNPVATVLADRGRYVAAALTVLRAYVAAGSPGRARRLASFEGWSDTVRSALIWLGRADPVATMEVARAEDPLMALLRAVLGSWAAHFGTGRAAWRTAADVLHVAEGFDAADTFPALKEAVLAVASNRGRPDARTFGRWLSRHRGRIVDGLRLEGEVDAHGHAARWWVDPHGTAVGAVSAVGFERRLEQSPDFIS